MSKQNRSVKLNEDDFISPKKGITLSSVSFTIWILTHLSYAIFIGNSKDPEFYQWYSLTVTFLLSVIAVIFIVKMLYNKLELASYFFVGSLNVVLIFTSANGIQAGHSFLNQPKENSPLPPTAQLSIFSFLNPRPWLPDAYSKKQITDLKKSNKDLNYLVDSLKRNVAAIGGQQHSAQTTLNDSLLKHQKEIEDLRNQNQALANSITDLNQNAQRVQQRLEEARTVCNNSLEVCRKNNELLNAKINRLQTNIKDFNDLQNRWKGKTERDTSFKNYASNLNGALIKFFDKDYYKRIFLTPIALE